MAVVWTLTAIILSVVVCVTATEGTAEAEATVTTLPLVPVATTVSESLPLVPVATTASGSLPLSLPLPSVSIQSELQTGSLVSESTSSATGNSFGGVSAGLDSAFGGLDVQDDGLVNQGDKEESQKQNYSGSLLGILPAAFLLSHHGHFGPFYHNGYHFCMPNIIAFHLLSKSSASGSFANLVRFWPYHGSSNSKLTDILYLNAMSKTWPNIIKQLSALKKKGFSL